MAAHGVALTGPIHLALAAPHFAWPAGVRWLPVTEFSLALMFILYAESYGSIRTFALKHDEEVRPNRDLIALGVANLVAGLFHGTPVGAGYSGTSANEAAGARSRLAGLAAAAVLLLLVLLFLRWIERIPEPVLAAIVIHAVSKSLRLSVFRNYFRWQRDRLTVLAAVLAVMVFGVLNGLLAAIIFSLAMLVRSLATPRLSVLGRVGEHDYVSVTRFPEALTWPDMLILRPEEPLFFANAEPLLTQARERVMAKGAVRVLILSLEESPDLDTHRARGAGGVLRLVARARRGAAPGAPEGRCARGAHARAGAGRLTRLFERGRRGAGTAHTPRGACARALTPAASRFGCLSDSRSGTVGIASVSRVNLSPGVMAVSGK